MAHFPTYHESMAIQVRFDFDFLNIIFFIQSNSDQTLACIMRLRIVLSDKHVKIRLTNRIHTYQLFVLCFAKLVQLN